MSLSCSVPTSLCSVLSVCYLAKSFESLKNMRSRQFNIYPPVHVSSVSNLCLAIPKYSRSCLWPWLVWCIIVHNSLCRRLNQVLMLQEEIAAPGLTKRAAVWAGLLYVIIPLRPLWSPSLWCSPSLYSKDLSHFSLASSSPSLNTGLRWGSDGLSVPIGFCLPVLPGKFYSPFPRPKGKPSVFTLCFLSGIWYV